MKSDELNGVLEWIELIIESCENTDQLISAENLIDNFNRILICLNVDDVFIENSKMRLFHCIEDKKDEIKK